VMKMIECRCQHCLGTFKAPDSMIGQVEKCPTCGQGVTVPAAARRVMRTTCEYMGEICDVFGFPGRIVFTDRDVCMEW